MFNLLVLIGVIGSQLFVIPGWSNGDELWVFYWLTLVIVSSLFFQANRLTETKPIGCFLICCFVSVLSNFSSPLSVVYAQSFIRVILGCLSLKVISERNTFSMKRIGEMVLVLWIAISFLIAAQGFGLFYKGYELSGLYTMPWIMGCAGCLSIPFLRKLKGWYSAILFLPILMSHSIACWAIAVVLFIRPRFSLKYILLVVLLILGYITFFDQSIDVYRFKVIQRTLPFWKNWVTGDGIGSWIGKGFIANNGKTLTHWSWAHNELYQALTETGVIGGLSIVLFLKNTFKRISFDEKYTLFGITALSMVHPIFHSPRLIVLIIVLLSVMLRRNSGVVCRVPRYSEN